MQNFNRILANNQAWAAKLLQTDPDFFAERHASQEPHFLWIGCSDSRVPAETLTGVVAGEMFVHRNIGNQVWETDMNLLAVLQYAVDVLKVNHVVVCGHTNCGALKAAMHDGAHGVLDHWLSDIRTVIRWNRAELDAIPNESAKLTRLSQLNVMQQMGILARTPIILDAWSKGQTVMLQGVVYDIATGLLQPVVETIDSPESANRLLPHV
ncbi:MAG: carbonic anhydrase [Gemmatimonadaceae bacterium]|nr:carbonic anhydrase [Gemmatimonadaceae bacterium]